MTGRLGSFYLVYFAVIGAFLPYWSLYLEDQGFDKRAIGILTALTMLTRMLAPMVWGWLADRSGRHMRWVRLATFMEAVACCLLLWRPDQLWQMGLLMLFYWLPKSSEADTAKKAAWLTTASLLFVTMTFFIGQMYVQRQMAG